MTFADSSRSTSTATLDAAANRAVDSGAVPQLVAIAVNRAGALRQACAGPRVVGADEAVTIDSLFRIASMTKILTTVAALQLRDRGVVNLDAPVETYCPDFGAVQVLDSRGGGHPRLREPVRPATVRHLLTHTSGLAYGFWNADLARWQSENVSAPAFDWPMVRDPGAGIVYGTSTDWLGRVVEVVTGRPLDEHLADHVLHPLDMHDTTFEPTPEQRARCVPVHDRTGDGEWVATDLDWQSPAAWCSGGHGLYSTPRDFLRLQRMLIDGGIFNSRAVLALPSVEEMFTHQTGDVRFPARMSTTAPATTGDFIAGSNRRSWGYGLLLSERDEPGMRRAGSGGWAGIFNTYFWIDRRAGLAGALYSQFRPFVTPSMLQVQREVERAVYREAATDAC